MQKKIKILKLLQDLMLKMLKELDKMIERCKAYIDAGAEIIFPEALENENEFEKVRKSLIHIY